MPGPYFVGQLVRMQNWDGTLASPTLGFRDANGALYDPSVVQLKVKSPSGVTTLYVYQTDPIVKDAVGLYHFDTLCSLAGIWIYEWIAPNQTLAPNSFQGELAPL